MKREVIRALATKDSATKKHKKHKRIKLSYEFIHCAFCAFLWLIVLAAPVTLNSLGQHRKGNVVRTAAGTP
jgi:hypothetical protein